MLNVDYNYEFAVGKGNTRKFEPLVNSINANAIHLQAPNSTGKTFLINLLAMGLFAQEIHNSSQKGTGSSAKISTNENGCISPILINGINEMTSLPTDKLRFDFTLTSKDGRTKLRAHKDLDNKRVDLYESIDGGKEQLLLFPAFKEKYYLVYDFPKSPLERIPDMVSSIKSEQNNYKNKINNLSIAISKKYGDVIAAADRENKRKEYVAEREAAVNKLEGCHEQLQSLDDKIHIFMEYILLSNYNMAFQEFYRLNNKHYTIDQEKKKGRTNATKSNNKYAEQKSKIEKQLVSISDKVTEFVYLIKATDFYDELTDQIAYIEDYNFLECVDKGEYEPTTLENMLKKIKRAVMLWKPTDEMKEASSKRKVYAELLKVLNELKKTQNDIISITIPGTDNKSLDQFIAILQESFDKADILGRKYTSSVEVKRKIEELEKIINPERLQREFTELKHLKRQATESQKKLENIEDEGLTSDEREKDLKRIDDLKHIILSYEDELREYNYSDVEALRNSTNIHEYQRQILKKYPYYRDELASQTLDSDFKKLVAEKEKLESGTIKDLENKIQRYDGKISEYENKTVPEYSDKSEELGRIKDKIAALYRKFTRYESYIDTIGNPNITNKTGRLDADGIYYNETLSHYFGNSFTSIVFQKEYVKPVKIDLVTGLITTDSGFAFPMQRLSTGQSMSMYVQTVLNRQDDKRKLIVLFDESGTMDQRSFVPIRDMLKPLVDEGKIMFALFVSKNNTELEIDTIA